jgi:hypothetical protein
MVSASKQEYIKRFVAFQGVLKHQFESKELYENLIKNVDETHFIINCDNGRTFGFKGDKYVKYVEMVSCGIGMTMVVKVTGGQGTKITAPFVMFQNPKSKYSIIFPMFYTVQQQVGL